MREAHISYIPFYPTFVRLHINMQSLTLVDPVVVPEQPQPRQQTSSDFHLREGVVQAVIFMLAVALILYCIGVGLPRAELYTYKSFSSYYGAYTREETLWSFRILRERLRGDGLLQL